MVFILAQSKPVDPILLSNQFSEGASYGSVLLVLVLVLCSLAIAFIYLRRHGFKQIKKNGELDILETRSLGGRQFLLVARVGDEKFLLGVCPGRIDYLCPLQSELEAVPKEFPALYQQATDSSE